MPGAEPREAPADLERLLRSALRARRWSLLPREAGSLLSVEQEVAWVEGLPDVGSEELIDLPGGRRGLALNLDAERLGVVLLDDPRGLESGDAVRRTHRVADVPVGPALLGRVIDPTGRPLDGRGPIRTARRLPVERDAPPVLGRAPVTTPLQTGIKAVDALVPIGRGQRELIIGDRQTGKTAIAVDAILNQKGEGMASVYCAIGQRSAAVASVIEELRQRGAMEACAVVATTGADPAGMQFLAPYAAMSIAESFMEEGRDALVVLDDLTKHARAHRELSLLLRRTPGREAYPGDVFYIHARLLERATHLLGGGTLTALPIVETEEENISAYIPTNLISITDGQIHLSARLFRQGTLPAVDVGRSVSRVGGDAQLPAYHAVSGDLRVSQAQFEELERFSRYGTKLDEQTRRALNHGRRVRAVLQQDQADPFTVVEQVAVLFAACEGLLDPLPVEWIPDAERALRRLARSGLDGIGELVTSGGRLGSEARLRLAGLLSGALAPMLGGRWRADA